MAYTRKQRENTREDRCPSATAKRPPIKEKSTNRSLEVFFANQPTPTADLRRCRNNRRRKTRAEGPPQSGEPRPHHRRSWLCEPNKIPAANGEALSLWRVDRGISPCVSAPAPAPPSDAVEPELLPQTTDHALDNQASRRPPRSPRRRPPPATKLLYRNSQPLEGAGGDATEPMEKPENKRERRDRRHRPANLVHPHQIPSLQGDGGKTHPAAP